jgi:Predicted phosphatases
MKYKAALFDLDGTLLDTLDDLADSMNAVLASFSMPPHPSAPYRYYVGDGMENLASRAAPEGTDDVTIKKMAAKMGEIYKANWDKKTSIYPGIVELLDNLENRGVQLAVLSNKPDLFTQLMIKHYFGESRFCKVFGAREGVAKKPDPVAALEIADALSIAPADFLYFGDTNTDMQTGVAAGMFTIGVTWGFRPRKELEDSGAMAIINHPLEALCYLD